MPHRNYTVGDPRADQLIQELVALCPAAPANGFLREILTTVVKLGQEHSDLGDYKLINSALKELRHALRVFIDYRDKRKVVVFGSARTAPENPCYQMAQSLCEALAAKGFMVITGAGGGIMEAGNRGAGRENSFGLNIKLPMEQKPNSYLKGDPKLMTFKYFFTRKLIFIKESDATVLFPGGLGTLDEGFETLTLFQTGKTMPRPVVLVEPENETYWDHWLQGLSRELLQAGYISPADMNLFQTANSIESAIHHITQYYKVYHSLRYVGDRTALRLTRELPQSLLQEIRQEFADILVGGTYELSPPLEDEVKKQEFLDLPRLVFRFNKRDFGRLNALIHKINQAAS